MESSRVRQGVLWGYWGKPRAWLGAMPPCRALLWEPTEVASRSRTSLTESQGLAQLPGVQLQPTPRQVSWETLLDAFSSEAVWMALF